MQSFGFGGVQSLRVFLLRVLGGVRGNLMQYAIQKEHLHATAPKPNP